jgi:hypothetical protein
MGEFVAHSQSKSGRDVILDELIDEAGQIYHLSLQQCSFSSPETYSADEFRTAVVKHFSIFPTRYAAALCGREVVSHMELLSRITGRGSDSDSGGDRDRDQPQYVVSCELLPRQTMSDAQDATVKIIIVCWGEERELLSHSGYSYFNAQIIVLHTGV